MYIVDKSGIRKKDFEKLETLNRESVEICKSILRFVVQEDSFPKKETSYKMKHIVENYLKSIKSEITYVSNGEFIQAAQELNLPIKSFFNNQLGYGFAGFKFDEMSLSFAILKFHAEKKLSDIPKDIQLNIHSAIRRAYSEKSKTTIHELLMVCNKNINLELTGKDLLEAINYEKCYFHKYLGSVLNNLEDLLLKVNVNEFKKLL